MATERLSMGFLPLVGQGRFDSRCFLPDMNKDDPMEGYEKDRIIVLPNLDMTYHTIYEQVPEKSCILASQGGPGSHMITVNKKDISIGIVENVHKHATNWSIARVDFVNGTFSFSDMHIGFNKFKDYEGKPIK